MKYEVKAEFSDDGARRYWLSYGLVDRPNQLILPWIMLNPSEAGGRSNPARSDRAAADNLDPTLRRVRGFTEAAGYDGFRVVNLYTLIDPKPSGLVNEVAADLAMDEAWIMDVLASGGPVVCAWGAHRRATERASLLWQIRGISAHASQLHCLRTTAAGHPQHPLYLPASLTLKPWSPPCP